MSEKIIAALKNLDPQNDNHWTADGEPRLDTVRLIAADQKISRQDVAAAWVGFTRQTAAGSEPPAAGAVQPVQAATPAAPQATPAPMPEAKAPATPIQPGTGLLEKPISLPTPSTVAEAAANVDAARLNVEKAKLLHQEAMAAHDALLADAEPEAPSTTTTIQGYLASQRQLAAQRAQQMQNLRDAGVDGKMLRKLLPTASQLDAAMSRKVERGTNRPAFVAGQEPETK